MKTTIKIVFIILVMVLHNGCTSEVDNCFESANTAKNTENDGTRVNIIETSEFANPFIGLGVLHNQAMDSVRIKSIPIANMSQYTHEFTIRHADAIFGLRDHLTNYNVQRVKYIKDISKRTIAGERTAEGIEICDSIILETPSIWQPYLKRMKVLIEKSSESTVLNNVDIIRSFNELDVKIYNDNKLTGEYKGQLLAISAITQASMEYHCDKQGNSLQHDLAETIVKADFEGAVCGALDYVFFGGSVTGLMFGPGGIVLSCGAYIVKGAILGSAVGVASRFFW